MNTILLILTVLCTGPVPLRTVYAETTQADFQTDVQLVRMGWYVPHNDTRCKAVRVKYTTKEIEQ